MSIDDDLEIYDFTFSSETAINVINFFLPFAKKSVKSLHGYFERNNLKEYNNPIEFLIDDYLDKIGDSSPIVEYWYRLRWIDLPCHQDLNEYILKTTGKVVNPNNGHIMYLSDRNNESATLLFNSNMNAVTLIYPKVGRTVKFKGLCYHAVPGPFSKLFGNKIDENNNTFRHVLLFNTWNKYENDPEDYSLKSEISMSLRFTPKDNWVKLPLFDHVRLKNYNFKFSIEYMGNSKKRFGTEKTAKFFVDERMMNDGYHQRMISYECEKVPILKFKGI